MNKLCSIFFKMGYADETNIEIVTYGLQRIHDLFVDTIVNVVCSMVMGNIRACLLYEVCYIALRIYAGGYHAASKIKCKYLSFGSIILSISIINYLPVKMSLLHFLMIILSVVILLLAPVESVNKPLTHKEKIVFRHRVIIIIFCEVIIYYLAVLFNYMIYAKAIFVSIALVAAGIVGGTNFKMKIAKEKR